MMGPIDELPITGWDNFYVMIGSAAGALLGLTFVVIALVADNKRANPRGLRTFISPTIGHFCTVLALAGFMLVPGQTRVTLSIGFGLVGTVGLIYSLVTGLHMHRMPVSYVPVIEDWLWHVLFPLLTYASLLLIADLIWHAPKVSFYAIAGALTLFLFIGIHNAWDVATSISLRKQDDVS
jgi:hypothetical protein